MFTLSNDKDQRKKIAFGQGKWALNKRGLIFPCLTHRDRCGVCGALERKRARSRSESEDEWRCLQPYT